MRRLVFDTMVQVVLHRGRVPEKWSGIWRDIKEGRACLILQETLVAELSYRLVPLGGEGKARQRVLWLKSLRRTEILHTNDEMAMRAGFLHSRFHGLYGVGLVDCFALAAAESARAELITADVGIRDTARDLRIRVNWLPLEEVDVE